MLGEFAAAWRYPRRQCTHGTERTPCAWRINKRKDYTHNGGYQYDGPEHMSHGSPVAPCLVHLYTEHCEDEHHHENPESPGTNKCWNRSVRRVFGKHLIIEAPSRTCVSTPPASSAHGKCHRGNHANYCKEPDYGIKIPRNKICQQNPIQRESLLGQ